MSQSKQALPPVHNDDDTDDHPTDDHGDEDSVSYANSNDVSYDTSEGFESVVVPTPVNEVVNQQSEDLPCAVLVATNDDGGENGGVHHSSRESILRKIKNESTLATEVRPEELSKKERTVPSWSVFSLMTALFVVAVVVGTFLGVFLRSSNNKKQQMAPTSPPKTIKENDVSHLIDLLQPISGESVFQDTSSPQYKAVQWLTQDDDAMNDIMAMPSLPAYLAERYILVVFYFSTGGPNWNDNVNFLSTTSVCAWNRNSEDATTLNEDFSYGAHCDSSGWVTRILLDLNNLNGTLPAELSSMRFLQEISVLGNSLFGTIPDTLGQLGNRQLKHLQLASNQLTGSIPESISTLKGLLALSLSNNQLTGTIPSKLMRLSSLKYVDLSINALTGTLPEVLDHANDNAINRTQNGNRLIVMSVGQNLLEGPLPASLFSEWNARLEWLHVGDNMLTGSIPSTLGAVSNLFLLLLYENDLSGTIPPGIGGLEFLATLELAQNSLTGPIPTEVGKLINLQRANFTSNLLTGPLPSEIGNCEDLFMLSFEHNPGITGTIPDSFLQLSALDIFWISDTSISGSVDFLVCDREDLLRQVILTGADCGGISPRVECSCCATCCDSLAESYTCVDNTDRICNIIESYALIFGFVVHCDCATIFDWTCVLVSNITDTPYHGKCPSCNQDGTICGAPDSFGMKLADLDFLKLYENEFSYHVGRNETITWHEIPEVECHVWINGQACTRCSVKYCRDGFPGRSIDCSNVVVEDGGGSGGGGTYDSCEPFDAGGLFEYFYWIEESAWNGCLPFFYDSVHIERDWIDIETLF